MRKIRLGLYAVFGLAMAIQFTAAAGQPGQNTRSQLPEQNFGLPPVTAAQFADPAPMSLPAAPQAPVPPAPAYALPPSAYQGGPGASVYTATAPAAEGTANFLDPNVAAVTLVHPLPPAPSNVSTGAVSVHEARPLPAPSAPYSAPAQMTGQAMYLMPAPGMTTMTYAANVDGGTADMVGAGRVAVPGQPNVIPYVVPVQIPASAVQQQQLDNQMLQAQAMQQLQELQQQQAQLLQAQGIAYAHQQAAIPAQTFQMVPTPTQVTVDALTPGTNQYFDFSVTPSDSVMLVTPAQVKEAIMRGVPLVLLDVRAELVRDVEGNIRGDAHVEYMPRETFVQRVAAMIPNRNIPIVVYCHDGIWSSQAGADLAHAGFKVYVVGAFRLWL